MAMQKSELGEVRKAIAARDPFAIIRRLAAEFDPLFEEPWAGLRWPLTRGSAEGEWLPNIDVFERDGNLVTRIDLPGLKKEDVKVEVADGRLVISGERRSESEEKKEAFYRSERKFGSFYRAVPLPAGVKVEEVKAAFADGVLEVSVPLPAKAVPTVRNVEIEEGKPAKAA